MPTHHSQRNTVNVDQASSTINVIKLPNTLIEEQTKPLPPTQTLSKSLISTHSPKNGTQCLWPWLINFNERTFSSSHLHRFIWSICVLCSHMSDNKIFCFSAYNFRVQSYAAWRWTEGFFKVEQHDRNEEKSEWNKSQSNHGACALCVLQYSWRVHT